MNLRTFLWRYEVALAVIEQNSLLRTLTVSQVQRFYSTQKDKHWYDVLQRSMNISINT